MRIFLVTTSSNLTVSLKDLIFMVCEIEIEQRQQILNLVAWQLKKILAL